MLPLRGKVFMSLNYVDYTKIFNDELKIDPISGLDILHYMMYIALANISSYIHPLMKTWKSKLPIDNEFQSKWFVAGIEQDQWQLSCYLPLELWDNIKVTTVIRPLIYPALAFDCVSINIIKSMYVDNLISGNMLPEG